MTTLYDLDPRHEYLLTHPLDAAGWQAIPMIRAGLQIQQLDHARVVTLSVPDRGENR